MTRFVIILILFPLLSYTNMCLSAEYELRNAYIKDIKISYYYDHPVQRGVVSFSVQDPPPEFCGDNDQLYFMLSTNNISTDEPTLTGMTYLSLLLTAKIYKQAISLTYESAIPPSTPQIVYGCTYQDGANIQNTNSLKVKMMGVAQ